MAESSESKEMNPEYMSRDSRDLLVMAVTKLDAQGETLSEVKSEIKEIGERCDALTNEVNQNKTDISNLNTRWKVMVGIVGFVIVTLIAVAGVVVAYLK